MGFFIDAFTGVISKAISQSFADGRYVQKAGDTTTGNLDINAILSVNSIQSIYVPNQSTYQGSMFFGTGGLSLTGSGGQGQNNIGVGISALQDITTGIQNIAIGTNALRDNTTGANNFAFGYDALQNNISGSNNLAINTS